MIARLILGAIGLLLVGVAGWLRRENVKDWAKSLYKWSLGSSEFWGLAETFWNEAAVLWFVFPLLDGFYEQSKDRPPPSVRSILGSFVAALIFFMAAVYSEKKSKKLKKIEDKLERESEAGV